MILLLALVVLEEEILKFKNHNLFMTQTIPKLRPPKRQWKNTSFPYKKRNFRRQRPNKQRNNGRPKNACYHCGRFGHIRKNLS